VNHLALNAALQRRGASLRAERPAESALLGISTYRRGNPYEFASALAARCECFKYSCIEALSPERRLWILYFSLSNSDWVIFPLPLKIAQAV
jgi:hypothetical protein